MKSIDHIYRIRLTILYIICIVLCSVALCQLITMNGLLLGLSYVLLSV